MPLSARRQRTRKLAEVQDVSDNEIDSITTPGRKRRRINTQQATVSPIGPISSSSRDKSASNRRKTRSSDIKIYEDDSSFTEDDTNTIIRNLKKANYEIVARSDYGNEIHEVKNPQGTPAYAKIAGNGWTFYMEELEVTIGRPSDERHSEGPDGGDNASDDKRSVHIDLGPSKHVSRQHAEIRYHESSGEWCLSVLGRNGAKVDESQIARDDTTILRSGSIIEIAGTQMMFVTPNEAPKVHPDVLAQLNAHREEFDEDEDDIEPMQPPSLPHRTPTKSQQFSYRRDPSSSQIPSSSNQYGKRTAAPSALQNDGSLESIGTSSQSKAKSPTYSRGLMLETTEDIDYSQDSAKDLKPPHSYAQLIGMAILSSSEEKLTLAKIYDWIKERYAFYRHSPGGWQNSIRHNLSLNKTFQKVARRTDEPGKGMKWQINPEHRDEFMKKGLSHIKTMTRSSSGPNSPTREILSSNDPDIRSDNQFTREFQDLRPKKDFKTSPGSTPPVSHYPKAKQAFTPDRGSNIFGKLHGPIESSSPRNGVIGGFSPFPFSALRDTKTNGLTEAAAQGSPGGPRISLNSETNDQLFTPLISRYAPKLAPPSTARLPSQFMQFSSPAPFWKYGADFGSTPAKPETSPVKALKLDSLDKAVGRDRSKPKDDSADPKGLGIQSSSPPIPDHEIGHGTPSKGSSVRTRASQTKGPSEGATRADQTSTQGLADTRGTAYGPDEEEEEEEGGIIDLARGFQPIGSFHRNISAGIVGRN